MCEPKLPHEDPLFEIRDKSQLIEVTCDERLEP